MLDSDAKAGTVVNALGKDLLAVVSSTRLKDTLQIDGADATLKRLLYGNENGGFRDATDD